MIRSTLLRGEGGGQACFKQMLNNISKSLQICKGKAKILKYFASDCVQNGKFKKKGRWDKIHFFCLKNALNQVLITFPLYMGSLGCFIVLFMYLVHLIKHIINIVMYCSVIFNIFMYCVIEGTNKYVTN